MDYLEIRELYHHGIKGQKWGIRRYQNEDGSLTEAGKKRYLVSDIKSASEINKMTDKEKMDAYKKERKGLMRKEMDNLTYSKRHYSLDREEDRKIKTSIAKDNVNKILTSKYGDTVINKAQAADNRKKVAGLMASLGTIAVSTLILDKTIGK